jgi:hypothetical protein
VSLHRIVGKRIGILWRSECLLFVNILARTFQNMACRVQSCLEANGGHFQHILWCCHISHTTNVLLFKFRCNIIIGVRIIKEMPGLVGSGTPCICIWINSNTYLFLVLGSYVLSGSILLIWVLSHRIFSQNNGYPCIS